MAKRKRVRRPAFVPRLRSVEARPSDGHIIVDGQPTSLMSRRAICQWYYDCQTCLKILEGMADVPTSESKWLTGTAGYHAGRLRKLLADVPAGEDLAAEFYKMRYHKAEIAFRQPDGED